MSVRRLWWLYGGVVLVLWLAIAVVVFATPREMTIPSYPVSSPATPIPTPIPVVEQVIAVQAIPSGSTISSQALTLRPVPLNASVRGGYTNIDDVAGQVAAVNIQREQIITDYMLQNPNLAPDIRATVTERAQLAPPTSTVAVPNIVLSTPTPVPYMFMVMPVYALPAGTTITAGDVTVRPFPADMAPFATTAALDDVVGKVTAADLPANYPVLASTLLSADNPTAPTPFPPPDGVCVVTAGAAQDVPLYDAPDASLGMGTLRPNTTAVVVAEDNGRYEIELPGGMPLGWVNSSQVAASGGC